MSSLSLKAKDIRFTMWTPADGKRATLTPVPLTDVLRCVSRVALRRSCSCKDVMSCRQPAVQNNGCSKTLQMKVFFYWEHVSIACSLKIDWQCARVENNSKWCASNTRQSNFIAKQNTTGAPGMEFSCLNASIIQRGIHIHSSKYGGRFVQHPPGRCSVFLAVV